MAHLIVENGPQQGTTVSLTRDAGCSIGNDPECDLVLTGPGIANRHLVVKALREDGFGVRSLDSSFTLNNRSTEAARLADDDLLEIGGTRIRFGAGTPDAAGHKKKNKMLGGFRITEVLGAGGMGTVYRAEQINLNREVALKVLSKDLTEDPVFVARFVAEARAAARLHHPNVVQVFDVGHDGDTFYYSMELMHEGSVEDRLKAQGKLDVEMSLAIVVEAARGLAYAESLRIVHRDIKPDNLMLDRHGHVKIADLGLAMTDEDDVSKVIGTPHFMSPEQALGKALDHRSDLYSLGCTFYRLLTGRTPFRRDTVKEILRAHVKDQPEPVHKVVPEVSAEVSAIVDRLLQKDPADRYQSATDLVEQIEAVLAPPSRKGMVIAGLGVGLVIAGGGLIWGFTRPEGRDRIIREQIKDPRVKEVMAKLEERDAEIAYLRSKVGGLQGDALASALEQMAAGPFQDSTWARTAKRDAEVIRAALASNEAERLARHQAVTAAAGRLRGDATAAIEGGDYARALKLLELGSVPADMRATETISATVTALRGALRDDAGRRLTRLRETVERARTARNPAALRTALAAFEPVIANDGWPAAVFDDRGAVTRYVADANSFLASLETDIAALSLNTAWQTYVRTMVAPDGVLERVDAFDLDGAKAAAQSASETLQQFEAGPHAGALAESLDRAKTFLERFHAAANAGKLTRQRPEDPEPRLVLQFDYAGEQTGMTLKVGSKIRPTKELLPLAVLRGSRLATVFLIPGDPAEDPERAAFLGWIALADHVGWARGYLARIDKDDPESGTGASSYPGRGDTLARASHALDRVDAPWARALQRELASTELLVRALRAFSAKRNLSAANYLEQLRNGHDHSIVTGALRSD